MAITDKIQQYRQSKAQPNTPFYWPSWRENRPLWKMYDYKAYVHEGFNLNSLIYSAVMFKARAMNTAPLRAYTGTSDNPVPLPPEHELAQLVNRPNRHQSWIEFQQQATVYLNISGNNFTYLLRERSSNKVRAMFNLRPDRCFIVPGNIKGEATVKAFLYVPEGKSQYNQLLRDGQLRTAIDNGKVLMIIPDDMMHVKLPNPFDPLEGMGYGLSPISSMARNADVDNQVTYFLKAFFDRGMMPTSAVTYDMPLNDDIIARTKERFKELYAGVDGWVEPLVLGQEGKVDQLSYTFDEMGFDGIDERNETRILGPFGVPPILVGSRIGLNRSTYSNSEQAEKQFWNNTLIPEILMFQVEYQYFLNNPDEEAFVQFDFSAVAVLQNDINMQTEAADRMWKMGVPANMALSQVGIKMAKIPGGDISYIPMGMIPAGSPIVAETEETVPVQEATPDEEEPMDSVDEDTRKTLRFPLKKKRALTKQQRDRAWLQVDRSVQSWEARFKESAKRAFAIDLRNVLAIMNQNKSLALSQKQTINWNQIFVDWKKYFEEEAPENWREQFQPLLIGVMTDTAELRNAQFGMSFDVQNLFVPEVVQQEQFFSAWFDEYADVFSQEILQTTQDDLRKLLIQANDEGFTVDEMRKQIQANFARYVTEGFTPKLTEEELEWFTERLPKYRTEMIARTETLRASNSASQRLYEEWGVTDAKMWLNSGDDRVRPTHVQAGLDYDETGAIPLNEPFRVGNSLLMYPTDTSLGASPEEVVQCRCQSLPVINI